LDAGRLDLANLVGLVGLGASTLATLRLLDVVALNLFVNLFDFPNYQFYNA
jgi:hypothetical protein